MKTRKLRPCQFCGQHSVGDATHEGNPICRTHAQELSDQREQDRLAAIFRARQAARLQGTA